MYAYLLVLTKRSSAKIALRDAFERVREKRVDLGSLWRVDAFKHAPKHTAPKHAGPCDDDDDAMHHHRLRCCASIRRHARVCACARTDEAPDDRPTAGVNPYNPNSPPSLSEDAGDVELPARSETDAATTSPA